MEILVFSDSHGDARGMREALSAHRTADAAVFCGDGLRDFDDAMRNFPLMAQFAVTGNWDTYAMLAALGVSEQPEILVDLEGVRFLILHGNTLHVREGYDALLEYAGQRRADAVLFGHTHLPENSMHRDPIRPGHKILLFNPGSVGRSLVRPYGIVTAEGGSVTAEHHRLTDLT